MFNWFPTVQCGTSGSSLLGNRRMHDKRGGKHELRGREEEEEQREREKEGQKTTFTFPFMSTSSLARPLSLLFV